MAFVKAGMVVPPATLVAGTPARIVRNLSVQEMAWKVAGTALYQQLTRRLLASMKETQALTEVEPECKRLKLPSIKSLFDAKEEGAKLNAVEPRIGLEP